MPDVLKDKEKSQLAKVLFHSADAKIESAQVHYRTLSFLPENASYKAIIPNSVGLEKPGIRDFIEEFTVGAANRDAKTGLHISLTLDILTFLEKTYALIDLVDYFLVFKTIDQEDCRVPRDEKCWNVVVQYWPSTLRTERFTGTREEISSDLAVLVLRGALRVRDDSWRQSAGRHDAPPYLMEPDMPQTMVELAATAKGISILTEGTVHPSCTNHDQSSCLAVAVDSLKRATYSDNNKEHTYTPVGAYGFAIVHIDAAVRAASRGDSALTVVRHLRSAELWTQRALTSDYLESKLNQPSQHDSSSSLIELSGLRPSDHFLSLVQRFSCALLEHWRANWKTCVDHFPAVEDFPPLLRVYLESAILDAKVNHYSSDEARHLLRTAAGLDSSSTANDLPFRKILVVVKEACHRRNVIETTEFAALVNSLMNSIPQGNAMAANEAIIRSSNCREGQVFPSSTRIHSAIKYIIEEVRQDRLEHGRLMLALSEYYVRNNDLDAGLSAIKNSLHLPWARDFVDKTNTLRDIRDSPRHNEEYLEGIGTINAEFHELTKCKNFAGGRQW